MSHSRVRVLTLVCVFAVAMPLALVGDCFGQCSTCAPTYVAPAVATSYTAVTNYRPLLGVYTTRLVPYTTASYTPYVASYTPYVASYTPYVASYTPYVASYTPYVASYTPYVASYATYYTPYVASYTPYVASYSPCETCGTCSACSQCSTCAPCSGCSAATCAAPAATCASCAVPATSAPANIAPPATYRSDRPAAAQEPSPAPQIEAKPNSMPAPLLHDPRDRTTARPIYAASRVTLTALPVRTSPALDDGGWRPSKD